MNSRVSQPQLGQNLLVVMDRAPNFRDVLRSTVLSLPQFTEKAYTLFCCCPTHYWEHGGADKPEVREEISEAWKEEEDQDCNAEHCLTLATALLEEIGVPSAQILRRVSVREDSLATAVVNELKQAQYTGVVVCRHQGDTVNRLLKLGLTDAFRHIPNVEVLPIDVYPVEMP